jgi:hypothetical protein
MKKSAKWQNLEKLSKQERMAQALRENLFKRKQQQRERSQVNKETQEDKNRLLFDLFVDGTQ